MLPHWCTVVLLARVASSVITFPSFGLTCTLLQLARKPKCAIWRPMKTHNFIDARITKVNDIEITLVRPMQVGSAVGPFDGSTVYAKKYQSFD